HFWALAIYRIQEYKKASIPMLPVTHGIPFTKLCIVLYTILLALVTCLPALAGMSGIIYLTGVTLLNLRFLYWAYVLYYSADARPALQTFRFSIVYLMALFILLLLDHYKGIYV
ncbi:MAG: UbiA family prenyltransferase, partial [Legionellaceae bacterium]|nr:UbiA family prenyltransferase [Legionellaceae bacterium]